MMRCPWCGAQNYAIDSWCSSCWRHLDWAPPAHTAAMSPPPIPGGRVAPRASQRPPRRRRLLLLVPAAAAVGVAIALALPVANWFNAAGQARSPALPNTALRLTSPTSPATSAPPPAPAAIPDATPTPDVTSTPEATPTPDATPSPDDNSAQAPGAVAGPAPVGDGPAVTVARFYQDVSAHDFSAAAALWTPRMQAQYPPAEYIDHRFAETEQIDLRGERVLADQGGLAIVHVDVVEVIDGQRRQWAGTWRLLNTASGWLLDQPNLRAAT